MVHHVFAWADRHKKINPIKQLEAAKPGSGSNNNALKLYKKREVYRIKKQRKQAKRKLLEAFMTAPNEEDSAPRQNSGDEPAILDVPAIDPIKRETFLAKK
jgi:hypothetical protein